ncbi:MAG: ABC transporter permease [Solirubrobacteraceae bacterium]
MSDVVPADLTLREVRGPSALGGGWRRSLDLVVLIAVNDFKKTYFGTALGYLWTVMRPLMLFAVLLVVFTKVVRFGSGVPHYPVLLLFNIVIFGFFQEATSVAVSSIVGQEGIVRRTQFPRLVIPLAVVLTTMINLALNLVVVFVFILAFDITPTWTWLLLPVVLLALAILTTAVSMIVSSLYPSFRDIGIIWSVFVTALFYATPVLYPIEKVTSHGLRDIILLNPIAPLLELGRKWVIDPHTAFPAAGAGGYAQLLAPVAIYVAICLFAVWIFNREAPRIAEKL